MNRTLLKHLALVSSLSLFLGACSQENKEPERRLVLATQAQSAGFRTLSYTVNDEWAAQRLIDLGTDGIITDRVDLFSPAG